MAKAKNKEVNEPVVEEEIITEVAEEVHVEELVTEAHDSFVTRKLKIINSLDNPLKAQRIANRLLRKRR